MRYIRIILMAAFAILCMGCGKATVVNTTMERVTKVQSTWEAKEVLIGEFSTSLSTSGAGKIHNLKLVAQFLNGYILKPGSTFSYNEVVGPRTRERGFKDGPMFLDKKKITVVGGGVCQGSGTLHGAVLSANLQVIERYRHSMPVDYCSREVEAAVVYGYKDFRFFNNTGRNLKITANVEGKMFLIQIWKINP